MFSLAIIFNDCTKICSRECFGTEFSEFSDGFLRTCGMGFAFFERFSTYESRVLGTLKRFLSVHTTDLYSTVTSET